MTEQKLVSWSYFDGKSLFSKVPGREKLTKIYAKNEIGEKLAKSGQVACLTFNILYDEDPYFRKTSQEGYTRKAKRFGQLVQPYKSNYPELENAVTSIKNVVKPYGEYVYIDLAFLDNYVNPFDTSQFFESPHFIKNENFTVANILKLINYRPHAMFGGEIPTYSEEKIPEFLLELKIEFPEIYKQLLDVSDKVKKFDESSSYIDKVAYVTTLSPGDVEIRLGFVDRQIFYWDGEVLKNKKQAYDKSEIEQIIKPSDTTTVTIKDNKTVNSKTIFI